MHTSTVVPPPPAAHFTVIPFRPEAPALTRPTAAPASLDTTTDLITSAQRGDDGASERLFRRCLPGLMRWARGRLPQYARDLADTHDIVQEAALGTLNRLHAFEPRHPGALQAFLRQAVRNRIRDEIRRVGRRPLAVELEDQHVDSAPSPVDHAIGREGMRRYRAAMETLRPGDRAAIIARIELQYSYDIVALVVGKPNANAARVAVTRALARLAASLK
jgi:RNA polymerase sigma-70 factor (ECF subfamily)